MPPAYLAWMPGGFPSTFESEVGSLPGVQDAVVVAGETNCIFGVRKFLQVVAVLIVAVRQNKTAVDFAYDDLSNGNAISQRSFERLRAVDDRLHSIERAQQLDDVRPHIGVVVSHDD